MSRGLVRFDIMVKLGVNIDHIATLRQARAGEEPDPVVAAAICEKAGADSIVCHLREDRRHIQDADVRQLKRIVKTRLNLEMSLEPEIVAIAGSLKPAQCTIVPERRQEVTTEGGLDVVRHFRRTKAAGELLRKRGIDVSLFINPEEKQIRAAYETGIRIIELHTGEYAGAKSRPQRARQLARLRAVTQYARSLGLTVNAGHGLNYRNVAAIAGIEGIEELNIGHAIISCAVFAGLARAVREMKSLIR